MPKHGISRQGHGISRQGSDLYISSVGEFLSNLPAAFASGQVLLKRGHFKSKQDGWVRSLLSADSSSGADGEHREGSFPTSGLWLLL